jgi:hypothetical protein
MFSLIMFSLSDKSTGKMQKKFLFFLFSYCHYSVIVDSSWWCVDEWLLDEVYVGNLWNW